MSLSHKSLNVEKFKVFGAALDALDLPEKVALKLAYTRSIKKHPSQELPVDPYDAIKDFLAQQGYASTNIEWIGKFPIETRLSPRPLVEDERFLKRTFFTDFLDKNGCLTYSEKLKAYLRNNVYPSRPVMIGVDHSLTGGVLKYIAGLYKDFNVLIFDSHTDIIDFSTKRSLFTSSPTKVPNNSLDIYECGSFISHLLNENVIKADRLWILGTQDVLRNDRALQVDPYAEKLRNWAERGVHLISKSDLVRNGIPPQIEGPTYVSIDIDLGCYSCVLACRFMDRVGLESNEIIRILRLLSDMIRGNKIVLLGLDVMEIDVHFLNEEVSERHDYTLEIVREIFKELIFSVSDRN
jgi:arginase family enzyme